jgi:hypothetical protein
MQADAAEMPDGRPALLLQVIDTGPGLQGVSYQHLFDPSAEFGTVLRKLANEDNSAHAARHRQRAPRLNERHTFPH